MIEVIFVSGGILISLYLLVFLFFRFKSDLDTVENLSNMDNYDEPGIWYKIMQEIDRMRNDPD